MKLSKSDFLEKYQDKPPLHMEFQSDRVIISNVKDWNVNEEIQKYVGDSENCHFIKLELSTLEIKIE